MGFLKRKNNFQIFDNQLRFLIPISLILNIHIPLSTLLTEVLTSTKQFENNLEGLLLLLRAELNLSPDI